MVKKLSLLMAAVAVLAFAIPAMASAKPVVTKTAGVLAVKGEKFTGTGTEVTLNSSTLGKILCKKLNLVGTLEVNNTSEGVLGKGNGEFTAAECSNPNGTVIVTSVAVNYLRANGSPAETSVQASFKAVVDVGATTCTFEATEASPVTGTFEPGTNKLSFSAATGVKGGACGSATLTGAFALDINGSATAPIFDK